MLLPAVEVEAVLAVVEGLGVLPGDEACEGFAGVGGPVDGVVGGEGPEGEGEGEGGRGAGRGGRTAAPAGEGFAAPEEELLGEELVVGAGAVDGVGEEGGEVGGEEGAGEADRGVEGGGIEVLIVTEGEGLGGGEGQEF